MESGEHGALAGEADWLRQRPRTVLASALALGVAVVAFVALTSGSGGGATAATAPASTSSAPIGPIGLSAGRLKQFVAGTLKQPVYWAGPVKNDVYEVTRNTSGWVYVRYLTAGTRVGDPAANFLLVATYPYPGALQRLEGSANGAGGTLPGGAFVLPDAAYPKSVHLAYPRVDYEIEVYDPSPPVARHLASSGAIRPVG